MCKHSEGYLLRLRKDHPLSDVRGYVAEHRIVYEEHYKCCILPWTIIHHRNGIKTDNQVENLELTTRRCHPKIHFTGRRRPRDLVDRVHQSFMNRIKERMGGLTCSVCGINYVVGIKANWRRIADGYMCRRCDRTIFESNLRQVGYYRAYNCNDA